jgi:hypothetical protein
MKRVYFFSTPSDAATLLSAFDRVLSVQYVSYRILQLPAPKVNTCADQIPSLGISSAETGNQSDQYLVFVGSIGGACWRASAHRQRLHRSA